MKARDAGVGGDLFQRHIALKVPFDEPECPAEGIHALSMRVRAASGLIGIAVAGSSGERSGTGGVRQLLILAAGLDTTGFELPECGDQGRLFEVDHRATQDWKRKRIAERGWELPPNLKFAPHDLEQPGLLGALAGAGFERRYPALVSFFGVILYLAADAASAMLSQLGALGRTAGFRAVIPHPLENLTARYFAGRPDRLRLRLIERLLTAVC